jgi:probable F420-dependent oxidoreductase
MRTGLGLPHFGVLADPAGIGRFATAAEELGYESLWVGDRVLTPVEPSDLYPGGGTPDRPYPPEFTRFFDPLIALTVAATATSTIRLGTSTLVGTLYQPVLLGRQLTAIDQLSGGRLEVGLGLGWLRDEYTATGMPWTSRGRLLEELLDVLTSMWTEETLRYDGKHWTIPPSTVDLRPVQRPRPPILLGGFSPPALERVGRRADGWLAGGLPPKMTADLWDVARASAERAGRDPDSLRRVLRINPRPGTGLTDVAEQVTWAREDDTHETFVDVHYLARDMDHAIGLAGKLRELLDR